ncbi:MAG: hypothetical protein R3A80_08565 [Bdellovibrionota bacterium]
MSKTFFLYSFSLFLICYQNQAQAKKVDSFDLFVEELAGTRVESLNEDDKRVLTQVITPLLESLVETQKLHGPNDEEDKLLADSWVESDIRKGGMAAEAFFKLYKNFGKSKERECLEDAYTFVKTSFEDPVGVFVDDAKTKKHIDKNWGSPDVFESATTGISVDKADVLAEQESIRLKSRKSLLKTLKKTGWNNPDDSDEFKDFACFVSVKWPTLSEQKDYLKSRIVKEITKIEDTDYDVSELQEGLHEFRRDIRGISIWLGLARDYLNVEPSLEADLSSYVSQVGDIKDDGERWERFAPPIEAATGKSGATLESFLREFFQQKRGAVLDWLPRAKKIKKTFDDSKILEKIKIDIVAS